MAYEFIIYEVQDGVATITINRPKAMNALNPQVVAELDQAIGQVEADDTVKCVVITGAGDKAFVAGADIAAMVQMTALEGRRFSLMGQNVFFRLEKLDRPVIAAVKGFALGGGTELAMACDFIYAADNAKFGQPEINLGIIPGFGGTQRLTRLVGKARAKEIVFTGEMFDAARALAIGLINRMCPPEGLMEEAKNLARAIMAKGPVAVGLAKQAMESGFDLDLEKGLLIERTLFAQCFDTADQKEGMSAFLEKREAKFQGR